jgi:hypothetical protein
VIGDCCEKSGPLNNKPTSGETIQQPTKIKKQPETRLQLKKTPFPPVFATPAKSVIREPIDFANSRSSGNRHSPVARIIAQQAVSLPRPTAV